MTRDTYTTEIKAITDVELCCVKVSFFLNAHKDKRSQHCNTLTCILIKKWSLNAILRRKLKKKKICSILQNLGGLRSFLFLHLWLWPNFCQGTWCLSPCSWAGKCAAKSTFNVFENRNTSHRPRKKELVSWIKNEWHLWRGLRRSEFVCSTLDISYKTGSLFSTSLSPSPSWHCSGTHFKPWPLSCQTPPQTANS